MQDGQGRLALSGGEIELLEIPGEDRQPALILLHEGLGSVGLWRGFPERLANATHRRTIVFSRYGHGQSDPPPKPRTPTFMHEEALEVLPELLTKLGIDQPLLVGHSDGASIALIYAAHHPVTAVVAIAPHVFVEDMCLAEIRQTKQTFETTDLRERMARHHRDPDAAFYGWNDVWLHPEFPQWNIEGELAADHGAATADPGNPRPVRDDGSARLDRASRARAGDARPPRLPALAPDRAARPDRRGDRGVYERPAAFRYLATASGANTARITSDQTTAPHT